MAGHGSVRASRDGDQFHYHWAARRCLELLPGQSDLSAVTIEGASTVEGNAIEAGEELIDVGFYFGGERRETARLVRYTQLKHSTLRTSDAWTASGLKKTIEGFAKRYEGLVSELSAGVVAQRFRFEFTTNRPIQGDLSEALDDLASGRSPRHPTLEAQLLGYTDLDAAAARGFFSIFVAEGATDDLWAERNLLVQDVGAYLPQADFDAPLQLKELVTRKATTEFEANPRILRHDVLRALGVTEDELTPAPSLVAATARELAREQEGEILAALLSARTPLVVHAEGGVGKSILAARLARAMPEGSVAVLYDCFGDGLYRTSLNARHRPRDALVQMANELAGQGLCHPLIPRAGAEPKAYLRAFLFRLRQAINVVQARTPGASVCLIIDAADNAQMAAEDLSESASFVPDLIRAALPDGVRVAFTCRSHRRDKLRAPLDAVEIELKPFSRAESAAHLRGFYPDATEAEVTEFAVLSSDNPRVQALALSRKLPLPKMLRDLGPKPSTVDRALSDLLERAIARLKDVHGPVEAGRIHRLCEALAVLRPLVPIAVLARVAEMTESEVRSFALDLGRPLFVKGGSLHFLDEPAETWFRERFRPAAAAMTALLDRLRPLAADSSYAAAMLPELLLQVGRLDELVELALSGEALPTEPIARRDVELQRLIFALKACLHQKRPLQAAKLALKAAGETAGEQRQTQLIQDNTDLAAILLTPDRLEEIVARRSFGSAWRGSHLVYDAGLLSGRDDLAPEASSRLRMAMEWFEAWARNASDDGSEEEVSDQDRVEIAMALLRLRSAEAAAHFLRRWTYRRHALVAGAGLGRRLLDIGRGDQVEALARAAGNDAWLLLGLASAARTTGHPMSTEVLSRLLRLLADRRVGLPDNHDLDGRFELLEAVTSAVEMALMAGAVPPERAANVLNRYLPAKSPYDMISRYGVDRTPLLRAYALRAALAGRSVTLLEVAPESVRTQLERAEGHGRDHDAEFFEHEIGGLLPWFILGAEVICGRTPSGLAASIDRARSATAAAENRLYDRIAPAWQMAAARWWQVLRDAGAPAALYAGFEAWVLDPKINLWVGTTIALCRRAARADGLSALAMTLATRALEDLNRAREDAESRLADFTRLARAILPVSPSEAAAIFNRAVEFASHIGEENLDRWDALLHLGRAAGDPATPRPRTAHRLSRAAELTYEYVARDKYMDWTRTVHVLTGLCASSVFAILSRWRDRAFGDAGRLLPLAVNRLVERGALPCTAPIVFAGVDADWDRLDILKSVAGGVTDSAARERALQIGYRYMRVEPYGHETWQELSALGSRMAVAFPDLDRLLAATPPKKEAEPEAPFARRASRTERRDPNWEELFAGVDFTDPTTLRDAYDRLRTYDPPYQLEEFFKEAVTRAGIGREPELIQALASWPDFGRFELRYLIVALPKPIPARPALQTAVREAVLAICCREPQYIWRRGVNATLPFERLVAEGVVTEAEVGGAVLEGFAALADHLGAGGLFRVVDALASELTSGEADEALNYGLDLLEPQLEPDQADGPWRAALGPPTDLLAALAGYIWAGLGSPFAAVRWQYAHAVRNVAELGWSGLMEALLGWAGESGAGAFVDQGLEFYLWHARQWLAIGLARASLGAPQNVAAAAPLLRSWATLDHVLIRELAAQSLDRLAKAGVIEAAMAVDAASINAPRLPEELIAGWGDLRGHADEPDVAPESEDEKYYFGIDIGPYWFRPLGGVFGISERGVEHRAWTKVRGPLRWTRGGWRDDARLVRKLFRDREDHHSHGGLPRADDLRAYHGYHAMMMVAADLLESHRVRRRESETRNEFDEWLDSYRLTRADGWWLADRRDPCLIPQRPPLAHEEAGAWRWAVGRADFDAHLRTDRGETVIWGYWHDRRGDQTETISVRSALVRRSTAESLLVALQTASDPGRFILPDADHGDDLAAGEFRCEGWIHDRGRDHKLDEYDPWSERLHYPDPSPADAIVAALSLVRDPDGRVWRDGSDVALRGETWTRAVGYGREADIENGWRLSANLAFLEGLFRARPDDCLILCVAVRRSGSRYAADRKDFEEYAWPYELYYLMGANGVAHPF